MFCYSNYRMHDYLKYTIFIYKCVIETHQNSPETHFWVITHRLRSTALDSAGLSNPSPAQKHGSDSHENRSAHAIREKQLWRLV